MVRKTDDSGQDDDSVSIISNEEMEDESEQVQYSNLDKNLFGIRCRRTKIDKCKQIDDMCIETAKDALEDLQLKSLDVIPYDCTETELPKSISIIKYAILFLFGITGCYLSYTFIPMYIVSLRCL